MQFELILDQGFAQIIFDHQTRHGTFIHGLGKEVIGAPAAGFRTVHRGVGVAHQGREIFAIRWIKRNPNRWRYKQNASLDVKCRCQCIKYGL